jgi:hypothetical protein
MGLDINCYKILPYEQRVGINKKNVIIDKEYRGILSAFIEKAIEKEFRYYDFKKLLTDKGYNVEELINICSCNDIEYFCKLEDKEIFEPNSNDSRIIKIPLSEFPIILEKKFVLTVEVVGYQRSGANKAFYKEIPPDYYCVDLETLKLHRKKYFKKEFEENIIKYFEQDNCFVEYSY